MIVPGPMETLQIIDRSETLPVMKHIMSVQHVVALAAPALAAAADAFATGPVADRFTLMNRLEEVLRECSDSPAPGLGHAPPRYRVLPMSLSAIMSFSKIRQVLGTQGVFLSQTYAVAHGEDVPLLLLDTPQSRADITKLFDAGIDIGVEWITASSAGV